MRALPWATGSVPLMLAPMQGVTNRAVRKVFAQWVKPDVLFTEFMRVRPGATAASPRLSEGDLDDARPSEHGVPLVVQLIGRDEGPLVEAARVAQAAGAVHLNLNLGCPYGRMNVGCGGGMLERPHELPAILRALRETIAGTFSVKVRCGYSDPEQIFSLLPVFEGCGVDFLALHARTVVQRYEGAADHTLTARVVRETRLPVIANGDLDSAERGLTVLHETGAAGLMLGRGAMRDPLLFERLRGRAPPCPTPEERLRAHQQYLRRLAESYGALFHGDGALLAKLKGSLAVMELPEDSRPARALKKAKSVEEFCGAVEALAA
ncbi:MAG: tRNA-dihydrouridine synthase family protein [Myxococcaceae bacterium]|nr:tRNA-dihydrouridine synthase family protein [Myxococcaceae bacterium]